MHLRCFTLGKQIVLVHPMCLFSVQPLTDFALVAILVVDLFLTDLNKVVNLLQRFSVVSLDWALRRRADVDLGPCRPAVSAESSELVPVPLLWTVDGSELHVSFELVLHPFKFALALLKLLLKLLKVSDWG